MGKFIDLTGNKYGRLTVIKQAESIRDPNGKLVTRWYCDCDCGNNNLIIRGNTLRSGVTISCGCYMRENNSKPHYDKRKYNRYEIKDNYIIMYTSKNEPFYIDTDDLNKVKYYNWYYNPEHYLIALKDRKVFRLSRVIMEVTDSKIRVDHINHDTSDNRKSNLRLTTASTNTMNGKIRKNNTSGVTGVSWIKNKNKWSARLVIDGKTISLGNYVNFDDAVAARKEAEEKYFGEYSYDNSMAIAEQIKI